MPLQTDIKCDHRYNRTATDFAVQFEILLNMFAQNKGIVLIPSTSVNIDTEMFEPFKFHRQNIKQNQTQGKKTV